MARIAPGPRGLALVRTLRGLLGNPLPVLEQLQREHGDINELRGPGVRVVVLHHPADIEQMLVEHGRSTSKGPTLERVQRGMGRNLFTLEGDEHQARRTLLTPLFRPRDIAPQARWSRAHAAAVAASLDDGAAIDVGAEMDSLALAAMAHVMLGRPHGDEQDALAQLVHDSVAATPLLLDPMFPLKARLWPPHTRSIDSLVERWDALCDDLIQQARSQPSTAGPADVLHQLLAGYADGTALLDDDAALREELRGLLLSAHETTALALAWSLHNLARAPHARAAMLEEVDAVTGGAPVALEHVAELRYTRAVLDETLRMQGGTFVPRGALNDVRLDHAGVTIAAGTELLASMWTAHHDPRFWPEPSAYQPERFLAPDPARPRFAWFPFGGGRRTCIGMHLALQAGVIVLAELHRSWTFDVVDTDPPVIPYSNVLVRPSRPIVLRPTARTTPG